MGKKGIVNSLLPAQVAPGSQIDDEVVGFVKRPFFHLVRRFFEGEVFGVVNKKFHPVFEPLHGINVKFFVWFVYMNAVSFGFVMK